jgi:hypothetical protein
MASPRKKWLRRKLAETAEQEAQAVEVEVQPEPVVEEAVKAPAKKTLKRARKK